MPSHIFIVFLGGICFVLMKIYNMGALEDELPLPCTHSPFWQLCPAQDLCSLLDRSTISPLSFSQYIDPRYLGVSMGSDENISVLYFSIPSTGLLCMDELKDEYNLPHSVKSVQGADFHSQVDALAIFTGAIRGRRRTSYRAISEAHVYLIVAWFKKFFGRPKTIFCP